ncbi:MAG: hypothetical protein EPN47_18485 [Acidobacteria bacterium]|nr:MAG: hypothetical protein EPN47_18485 [Acidobacteriota bacterium]
MMKIDQHHALDRLTSGGLHPTLALPASLNDNLSIKMASTESTPRSRYEKIEVAYILGAGFSRNAGLPLQSQFTDELLRARGLKRGPSKTLVHFLCRFVREAFDHSEKAHAEYWPALEDIFTCIDLSANTGHHLGFKYPPSLLRTTRRALIARIAKMLHSTYEKSRERRTVQWQLLVRFFKAINVSRSAFINMNWDTVVEDQLTSIYGDELRFTYGGSAIPADFPTTSNDSEPIELRRPHGEVVRLVKMHGSVNWLYCDNCRRLFWFLPGEAMKVANQALTDAEWKIICSTIGTPETHRASNWTCCYCNGVRLGGRIATFSYRKALDFAMFQRAWSEAERSLRQAKTWVFIGYSLPAADYEFKYLLKRVELSRNPPPNYIMIAKDEPPQETSTYRNYQRFFGRSIKIGKSAFLEGLNAGAIKSLRDLY